VNLVWGELAGFLRWRVLGLIEMRGVQKSKFTFVNELGSVVLKETFLMSLFRLESEHADLELLQQKEEALYLELISTLPTHNQ